MTKCLMPWCDRTQWADKPFCSICWEAVPAEHRSRRIIAEPKRWTSEAIRLVELRRTPASKLGAGRHERDGKWKDKRGK